MAKHTGPLTPRDFQRAADQRLTTAEFLRDSGYNLDAMYLAGYAIECTLKALILELTRIMDRPDTLKKISTGKKMHDNEVLAGLLKDLGQPLPVVLAKKFRRYEWTTDLRYETGRTASGETRGFLKVAKETCDWVKGKLP
jgi:HEPN domain-containing protein